MRTVALLALFTATASAEPLTIGVSAGVLAWQKAAAPAPLGQMGLSLDLPVHPLLSVGLECTGAHTGETNSVLTQSTWPLRASLTADLSLTRQTLDVYVGAGPALVVVPNTLAGSAGSWSGLYAKPGLRLRAGIQGPRERRFAWRLQGGTVLRETGFDWDASMGLLIHFGGEQ